MAIHPPFLYLGFIGMTVPFAFAMAALISGSLSDRWIRITLRWTLTAWIFLTCGLVLGALWSYGVLGWGGYWAWDPVEKRRPPPVAHGYGLPPLGRHPGTAGHAEGLERFPSSWGRSP
jgi:hypothetical protein